MKHRRSLSRAIFSGLCDLNTLLAVVYWKAAVFELHAEFPSNGCSMLWNERFVNNEVRVMFKWNDLHAVDRLILTLGHYIILAAGLKIGYNFQRCSPYVFRLDV